VLSTLAHSRPGLAAFRHVYLVASAQDKYAPFHSARVELSGSDGGANADRKKAVVHESLVRAILAPLDRASLDFRRFDVVFAPRKRSIDSMIGRAAHIQFLTQPNYMRLCLEAWAHVFQAAPS
jgi:hypothetical protein